MSTIKIKTAALRLAPILIAASFAITGIAAHADAPFYHAVLAQGTAPDSAVSSDVIWVGHGNELTASEAGYRAPMVCAELAQSLGTVASFSAQGVALPQDQMTYCNKHARKTK